MPVRIVYKCRRCSEEYANGSAPEGTPFMLAVVYGHSTPESWGPSTFGLHSVHACDDKGFGVADLLGVSPPSL